MAAFTTAPLIGCDLRRKSVSRKSTMRSRKWPPAASMSWSAIADEPSFRSLPKYRFMPSGVKRADRPPHRVASLVG